MNDISGKFSLMVRADNINSKKLEQILGIKATSFQKKGIVTSKVIGENPFDVWSYEIKIQQGENIENIIFELLSRIKSSRDCLKKGLEDYEIYLKLYISSDFAQIQFYLSPNILEKLFKTGIGIQFSILSWGNVEE